MKYLKFIILIFLTLTLSACGDLLEYSVYEANVKDKNLNTTAKNINLIHNIPQSSNTFKFAFISDSHYFYDDLKTVIDHINKNDEILFVVFGGDLTEQSLSKEFEIFYDIMSSLKKPYITVVGNHEYNVNGGLIYSRMFGDFNYSFEFNNNKFILFDNIIWESKKTPDYDWLSSELKNNSSFNQVFVVAHIPPFGDQLTTEMSETYIDIMNKNNVSLSLHGHTHKYNYNQDVVSYLTAPSLKELAYGIITVKDKSFNVDFIEL